MQGGEEGLHTDALVTLRGGGLGDGGGVGDEEGRGQLDDAFLDDLLGGGEDADFEMIARDCPRFRITFAVYKWRITFAVEVDGFEAGVEHFPEVGGELGFARADFERTRPEEAVDLVVEGALEKGRCGGGRANNHKRRW